MPESRQIKIEETHTSMEDGSITVVCSAAAKTGCAVGCAYTITPHEAALSVEDRPDAARLCRVAHESIRTKIAELEADEPRTVRDAEQDHARSEHEIAPPTFTTSVAQLCDDEQAANARVAASIAMMDRRDNSLK